MPNPINRFHLLLLISGLLIHSQCQSDSAVNDKQISAHTAPSNEKAPVSITTKAESIDRIHFVNLKNHYKIEQKFTSGLLIQYTLIKEVNQSVIRLDSIDTYRGEDLYYQQGDLNYDSKNDWCVFSSTDSGSNDSEVTTYYVRATRDRLNIIFEFEAIASYVETEEEPSTMTFMETSVQKANKEEIVLISKYSFSTMPEEDNHKKTNEVTLTDKAIFRYNASKGIFEFKSCNNPRFLKVWNKEDLLLNLFPL